MHGHMNVKFFQKLWFKYTTEIDMSKILIKKLSKFLSATLLPPFSFWLSL